MPMMRQGAVSCLVSMEGKKESKIAQYPQIGFLSCVHGRPSCQDFTNLVCLFFFVRHNMVVFFVLCLV